MTPLPSRLRASALTMRTLDAVSLRPSSLSLIDREHAARIARELEEAAQALEAQRADLRDMQLNRFLAFANQDGQDTAHAFDTERSRWHFFNPMTADLWRYWLAAAQVAQEGDAGVLGTKGGDDGR